MPQLLTVPYLGTAEKDVVLVDWLVGEGQSFKKGQPLLVLETLKASFEVEAEDDGFLVRHLEGEGNRVPVQAALGVFSERESTVADSEVEALLDEFRSRTESPQMDEAAEAASTPAEQADDTPEVAGTPASPAARRRANELGVDIETVTGTGPDGLVRVEDVEARARARSETTEDVGDGHVDPRFLEQLRENREAFRRLSSDFKISLYRRHGALIGSDVTLGEDAVILAQRLVLGNGVRLGAHGTFEAEELIAGSLTQFGARCQLRCRRVYLGENAYFAPDVEIGGGGAMDPEAELVVGSHGFVGEHVHLNPCRSLVIGDEVVISRNAVVMTHSFGGSVLKGYPNRFAGVEIGDACQIGIGAVLFPGVTMGEGSILLSGSSLVTAIPDGRLFGGVPAEDLKSAQRELSGEAMLEIAQDLVEEFARQLELRGFSVRVSVDGDHRQVIVDHDGARHRLHFAPHLSTRKFDLFAEDVRVCLAADEAEWSALEEELVGIDLSVPRVRGKHGLMAHSFREFLRKRGVRLLPRTWSYTGGWL